MARSNPYQRGSRLFAEQYRIDQSRKLVLAEGRASRAKTREAKQKAQRQAAAARRALRRVPLLKSMGEYRSRLNDPERRIFDSLPLAEKARELVVEEQYPGGVPPDIPDPFAESGKYRSKHWNLFYSTRAGFRNRRAA
jgi:hypothetical protein